MQKERLNLHSGKHILRPFPVVQGDLSVTPLTGSPHGRARRPAVALRGGASPHARPETRAAELARTADRGRLWPLRGGGRLDAGSAL
jgi:hypothetical protein